MNEDKLNKLTNDFAKVDKLAATIDPGDEEDWGSLILGFALGKGLTVDEAHQFANHIRTETVLG